MSLLPFDSLNFSFDKKKTQIFLNMQLNSHEIHTTMLCLRWPSPIGRTVFNSTKFNEEYYQIQSSFFCSCFFFFRHSLVLFSQLFFSVHKVSRIRCDSSIKRVILSDEYIYLKMLTPIREKRQTNVQSDR